MAPTHAQLRKGNPLGMHQPFAGDLDVALFERWLELWTMTTAEQSQPGLAAEFQRKARRVAESLEAGLLFDPTRSTARPISA